MYFFSFLAQVVSSNESSSFEEFTPLSTDFGSAFLKMLLSLIFLVGLLLFSYWILKRLFRYRMEKGGSKQRIIVKEKRMISPKTVVYLLEIDGKTVTVAESHLEVRQLNLKTHESPLESATDPLLCELER